jgi:Bacteriocin-protection, YdeI or OmpD-Associated/Domain of unknown function (DUF1905)
MEKNMTEFEAKLFKIGSWTVLRLPETASAKLPSRGLAMVEGSFNSLPFQAPLEPDGKGSHWLKVTQAMCEEAKVEAGGKVMLSIEPVKVWPEPEVPEDLQSALNSHPKVLALWRDITTMARWDWIRWIRSTSQAETRKRRIEVALSKLKAGKRRPCCFNRSLSTEPAVSKNGMLLEECAP